jgi:hypothetical protein
MSDERSDLDPRRLWAGGADLGSRVATAAINLGLGVIIILLVNSSATSARRVRERSRQVPDEL